MKKIAAFLIIIVLGFALTAHAQKKSARNNLVHYYDISINIPSSVENQLKKNKIYLYGYKLGYRALIDSAEVKNHKITFKKNFKKSLDEDVQTGFYIVDLKIRAIPILLNKENKFAINFDNGKLSVENSVDNQILLNFHNPQNADLANEISGSFIGKYQLLSQKLQEYKTSSINKTQLEEIMNLVDFSDARYCNSPIFNSLTNCFLRYFQNEATSSSQVIDIVSTVLDASKKGGLLQFNNYSSAFYTMFLSSGDPFFEPAMLYIYDNSDKSWIPESQQRSVKRQMEKVRKLAIGAQIPEITAFDINGNQHSTNEISTKYTILWFWDPDCDHCIEQTPLLYDFYSNNADNLDFEVFAVEVNDDFERWKVFSENHNLNDWINLSTSMGETSVDLIDYFDIVTTPVVLLIDNSNKHTILARQISLNEIIELVRKNSKNDEK